MSESHDASAGLRELTAQQTDHSPCPICGQNGHPRPSAQTLDERIVRALERRYPRWERAQGACVRCVFESVLEAAAQRSPTSLQHELYLPYPVYSAQETQLLPTPVRLRANPSYSGRGVTIAFLDSGFDPHADLTRPRNRILRYVDCTDSTPVEKSHFGKRDVRSWHGLMTSCVAAGNGFMSDGLYRGLAYRANVVLVKTGSRRGGRIGDRAIYRALSWVIANANRYDIRVVNISLGGDRPAGDTLSDVDELVEEAVARGMVVVVASGNSGHERIYSPASAPSAITVGGLDDQNSLDASRWRLYHSNFGQGAYGQRKPELVAPAIWLPAPMLTRTETHNEGMFLWRLLQSSDREFAQALDTRFAQSFFKQSTLRLSLDEIRQRIRARMIDQKFIHAHYQHVDGTSFAAPIVSSIVAQMLEANPSLLPMQVRSILLATAQPLPHLSPERRGYGVVDAARAVATALRAPGGPLTGLPVSPYVTPWGISFYYHDETARDVALVGSFNDWQPQTHKLQRHVNGAWQLTIPPLPAGRYAYKFVVDQQRWMRDFENSDVIEDGYGGYHSLLTC